MLGADLAICAAGGSTWELAAIGVPAIQVVVADNQQKIGAWLRQQDSAIVLQSPVDAAALNTALRTMGSADARRVYSTHARTCIDGLGATRVVAALLDAEG